MNKKGFTLAELLAVMVILALLMMLIVPSIDKLMNNTDEQKYETYEKMMEEYAAVYPDKSLTTIKLSLLDNLEDVKKNCTGYVTVNRSTNDYKAYISCGDKYTTEGFDTSLAG